MNAPASRTRSRPSRSVVRGLWLLIVVATVTATVIVIVNWWADRPLRQARRALQHNDPRQALGILEDYLQAYPQSDRANALKARAFVAFGQWDKAVRLFERAGAADPDELDAYMQALFYLQQWSQALPVLERLLEHDSHHPDWLYKTAICRLRLGFFEEALKTAEQCASIPGFEAHGFLAIGMIQLRQQNNDSALAAWQRLLLYQPNADNLPMRAETFLLQHGLVLLDAGKPQDARRQIQRSIDLRASGRANAAIGKADWQLGHPELAEQAWRKAVSMDPSNHEARAALARLALEKREPKETIRWLSPLSARSDLESRTAYLLQQAYHLLNEHVKAEEWQQTAARLRKREELNTVVDMVAVSQPQSFWARVIRAYRFAERENWHQARVLVDGLLNESAENAFLLDLDEAIRERSSLPALERVRTDNFDRETPD